MIDSTMALPDHRTLGHPDSGSSRITSIFYFRCGATSRFDPIALDEASVDEVA